MIVEIVRSNYPIPALPPPPSDTARTLLGSGRVSTAPHNALEASARVYRMRVEWSSQTSTGGGVGSSTQSYETDQQVEIVRHRVSETAKLAVSSSSQCLSLFFVTRSTAIVCTEIQ
jgi:hypothetical protein